jgi:hypothetical protein
VTAGQISVAQPEPIAAQRQLKPALLAAQAAPIAALQGALMAAVRLAALQIARPAVMAVVALASLTVVLPLLPLCAARPFALGTPRRWEASVQTGNRREAFAATVSE